MGNNKGILKRAARCPQLSATEYPRYSLTYPLPPQRYSPVPTSLAPRPAQPIPHSDIGAKLENKALWEKFLAVGTEMILTKGGRRMFPEFGVSVSGLDSGATYALLVEAVPADDLRYKWHSKGWRSSGKGEAHLPARLYVHPEAPAPGHHWMAGPVSFGKLKVTNNMLDQSGHLILHSMHRYTLRLCVVRTSESGAYIGADMVCFDFPETAFIAVTSYQNEKLSQLKIEENPFAKGIKEFKSHREKHEVKTGVSGKRLPEEEPEVSDVTEYTGSKKQRPCSRVPSPAAELNQPGDHPAAPGYNPRPLEGEPRESVDQLGSPRDEHEQSRGRQTMLDDGLTPLRDKLRPPEHAPRLLVEGLIPPRDGAETMCKVQESTPDMAATRKSGAGLERAPQATGEAVGANTCSPQASIFKPQLWSPTAHMDTPSPLQSPALSYPHYPRMHQAFLDDYGYYFQLERARSAHPGDHMTFSPYVGQSGFPLYQGTYPFISHTSGIDMHYLYPTEYTGRPAMTVCSPTSPRGVQALFQKNSHQWHTVPSPPRVQQAIWAGAEMK